VLEISRRVSGEPGLLRVGSVGRLRRAERLRPATPQVADLEPRLLAALLGLRVRELGEIRRRHVAQVAREVEDLVVPEQRDDPARPASERRPRAP
jgi:hypothetical protein